jgi:hypothetical protein
MGPVISAQKSLSVRDSLSRSDLSIMKLMHRCISSVKVMGCI